MMMDMLRTSLNQEVVHEGWLIKSPPGRLARWRQRWFTLRHSGELPGQYLLEYYTDNRCKKLKGKIDLDQCEQVDAGLSFENKKEKYQHMFNIKTPKRIYYLGADNEADMTKWVDAICQVCGLKAYNHEEDQSLQIFAYDSGDSPPISPTSTLSNPYIPISECISGPRLAIAGTINSIKPQNINNFYVTKQLMPSPSRSPTTDVESIVTDDESVPNSLPNVNWNTFPSAGDLKLNFKSDTKKRFEKTVPKKVPSRPPKPLTRYTTGESPNHNYLNLDNSKPVIPSNSPIHKNSLELCQTTKKIIANDSQKHTNAKNTEDGLFRYDSDNNASLNDLPINKYLDSNNNGQDEIVPPPLVNRGLKPRKSDASDHKEPPSINRRLKPSTSRSPEKDLMQKVLISPNVKTTKPIPIPIMSKGYHQSLSEDDNVFEDKDKENENLKSNRKLLDLQYLDLDLDKSDNASNSNVTQQLPSSLTTTVYKTVDFVKTEAFNRTKQMVDKERKQCSDELT